MADMEEDQNLKKLRLIRIYIENENENIFDLYKYNKIVSTLKENEDEAIKEALDILGLEKTNEIKISII